MNDPHSFHIPVMGIGFSIDTPIKVAKYGISSVISLVDDTLIESMRKFYCKKTGEDYIPITKNDEDYRAKRITAYLNLVDRIVQKQFAELKASAFEVGSEISKYFELLSERSPLKILYNQMLAVTNEQQKQNLQDRLRKLITPGDINVNIMTKLDRPNYAKDGTECPAEYSDALAALRGYANSNLNSAIVFSAGINKRLYTYVENFKDFYADAKGMIKKKIILKVSDFRSSLTQGKIFAKKGLWVSEYRVESGLNCGGHAFATTGLLMGPILEEFKNKRQELIETLHKIYNDARKLKERMTFLKPHAIRVTAQGGIGTTAEDNFVQSYYKLEGTGWGTPFLLVPEVTNVDPETLSKLASASENKSYLSNVSPLGVPFNNLPDSSSDLEKERREKSGSPGSPCFLGHLVSNTEFTEKPICTASRQYQRLKLKELESLHLDPEEHRARYRAIVEKACICHDLGAGVTLNYHLGENTDKFFTAVCPGPNINYFSQVATLQDMVDHIYGRKNLLNSHYRPHMFMNELKMYIDYLKDDLKKNLPSLNDKQIEYFREFKGNLLEGIAYYRELFDSKMSETQEFRQNALRDLQELKDRLENLIANNPLVFPRTALSPIIA
ncbi:MAG: hypothetical protein WC552_06070 [Candidatus Omnitrophota bacterium]